MEYALGATLEIPGRLTMSTRYYKKVVTQKISKGTHYKIVHK